MEKAQYAIMRFAKYKGPEIGNIEAHNERTKEKYASNPDVDTSRSKYNFHLVKPPGKYRAESERQIAASGCRTRKDSIRMIETLFTASPEFFKGKKRAEIRVFFEEALHFLEQHQSKETIISAVVHMDEKTPHMHLCFMDFSLLSPLEFFADPKNGDGRNNQLPAMRVRVDCYTKNYLSVYNKVVQAILQKGKVIYGEERTCTRTYKMDVQISYRLHFKV